MQLSAAEHELSALSLHIDAIMVGYAVQALQAAKNKTKQAAIHRQALEEQQQVQPGVTCSASVLAIQLHCMIIDCLTSCMCVEKIEIG